MYRTQIYIDGDQRKLLKELAHHRGASLSELIREAIGGLLAKYKKPKKIPLGGTVALYNDTKDKEGSTHHDDLYE